MKLQKVCRSVRILRTVGIENDFTDRTTNRTVRESDLWIVNEVFQSVKVSIFALSLVFIYRNSSAIYCR